MKINSELLKALLLTLVVNLLLMYANYIGSHEVKFSVLQLVIGLVPISTYFIKKKKSV
jgi:hypothetical protein